MNPVLIYTDNSSINEVKRLLNNSIPYLQSLYDAFQAISVDVDLSDLDTLTKNPRVAKNYFTIVEDFVSSYLLEQAGTPSFNGVPISAAKVKELLAMPDISPIVTLLKNDIQYFDWQRPQDFSLLQLVDGVISKKNTADAAIVTKYTYYTKNDYGAELATKLNAIAASLLSLKAFLNNNYLKSICQGVEGLQFSGEVITLNMQYIRFQESLHPGYVSA